MLADEHLGLITASEESVCIEAAGLTVLDVEVDRAEMEVVGLRTIVGEALRRYDHQQGLSFDADSTVDYRIRCA